MRGITDVVGEPTIAIYRITTDITFRTLIHITATIQHTTPTIEIMDIGTLTGMVGGAIANTSPATTRTVTFITARSAHGVIEALIFGAHPRTDRSGKRTLNQIQLPQMRIIRDAGNQEGIKGGAKHKK